MVPMYVISYIRTFNIWDNIYKGNSPTASGTVSKEQHFYFCFRLNQTNSGRKTNSLISQKLF